MPCRRADQFPPRRVVRAVPQIHRAESHRPHRSHGPQAARWRHTVAVTSPGYPQRVTGEDGTLTSITEPGCPRRIFTSFALRSPSPGPPQTTVLRAPPAALIVNDTWSATDTVTPDTSARILGSREPRA